MFTTKAPRVVPKSHTIHQATRYTIRRQRRYATAGPAAGSDGHESFAYTRALRIFLLASAAGVGIYGSRWLEATEAHAESRPEETMVLEKPKKKSKAFQELNRDLISSQHLQVKRSWENPGVYAWGSNTGGVISPESDEANIKLPKRITFFDGHLLRDLKIDRQFAAAVTENGDLLQWGAGYCKSVKTPEPTLVGKNLKSIAISRDRIIALSFDGTVYSVPASKEDQLEGGKPYESSWIPYWSSRSTISYRNLTPKTLGWNERITALSSGLEHVLLLTSNGRLFSAASSSESFPDRGQLGIPGITWTNRPPGPYDMPHEVTTLQGLDISKIAAGDYHSLAVDRQGRVFSFGDNYYGQLGFSPTSTAPVVDAPSLIPIQNLYAGMQETPIVLDVAAGGNSTFFIIETTHTPAIGQRTSKRSPAVGRKTLDTYASGQGIMGGLGNGRWTHSQGIPIRIKVLSGLFEWDEVRKALIPIGVARLSVGSTHVAAVMDNVTHLGAKKDSNEHDTNFGADVLWWGGNEHYQLGTGKRNNVNNPAYIGPLHADVDRLRGQKDEHRLQITPMGTARIGEGGKGRKVRMEQRVECGRMVSAVYSAV